MLLLSAASPLVKALCRLLKKKHSLCTYYYYYLLLSVASLLSRAIALTDRIYTPTTFDTLFIILIVSLSTLLLPFSEICVLFFFFFLGKDSIR